MEKTLIIIPTYNERENIGALIPAVLEQDCSFSILVVDDSSPDGTAALVRSMQRADGRVNLLERPRKSGLGKAYLHAFGHALTADYAHIITMDGDFSHDPSYLPSMKRGLGSHDVVIGSRYLPGGGTNNWSLARRVLSRAGNYYARFVLGMPIHDCSAGFVGYRRRVLQTIPLTAIHSEGYSFLMEMKFWAYRLGFSMVELPIVFTERRGGRSKISRAILIEALWMVWRLRFAVPANIAHMRKRS
jgi:dolichol-phosphate mannosyltransferase